MLFEASCVLFASVNVNKELSVSVAALPRNAITLSVTIDGAKPINAL